MKTIIQNIQHYATLKPSSKVGKFKHELMEYLGVKDWSQVVPLVGEHYDRQVSELDEQFLRKKFGRMLSSERDPEIEEMLIQQV